MAAKLIGAYAVSDTINILTDPGTTYTVGDILYADTTTSLAKLASVTAGQVLTSGGVGVAPTWAASAGISLAAVPGVTTGANANGATLTSGVLNLEPATASFPGVVTTGTQTIAGNKTFTGDTTMGNITVSGANITSTGGVIFEAVNGITFKSTGAGENIAFDPTQNLLGYATTSQFGTGTLAGGFTNAYAQFNTADANNIYLSAVSVTAGDPVNFVIAAQNGTFGSGAGKVKVSSLPLDGIVATRSGTGELSVVEEHSAAATNFGQKLSLVNSNLSMSTARLIGRTTAATGNVEEITVGTGLTLTAGTLAASGTTVTSVGAINATSTANGASVTTNVLNLHVADGTNGGVVSTVAQTFAGDKTFSNNVIVTGDLTVNGTTTTVNSTTVTVDDKNIELGSVATPTDVTANGGGITLRGDTDKTITWTSSNLAWNFNQNLGLDDAKDILIASTTGSKIGQSSSKIGFFGATPVVQSAAYTTSATTASRSINADTTTVQNIANTLATLIADLKALGITG